jgi:hypothetical protein
MYGRLFGVIRRMVAALAAAVVASTATGCGSTADGPRMQICGEWIGRAETTVGSGPWYVDASGSTPTAVVAAVGSSPTWVQVSGDCQHGVRISISDPAVISVTSVIGASDGADAAVLISPVGAGHATLSVAGRPAIVFTVHVPTLQSGSVPSPGGSPRV